MTEPVFGDPETITVTDLKQGDFVISMPAQAGYRATRFSVSGSGIAAITAPSYAGGWKTGAYRQRKHPVLSRRITFLDRTVQDLPCEWSVTARRILTGAPPTLDEQIAALTREYNAACAGTAAGQGEQIVDTGGWAELAYATVALAGPEISSQAKAGFLRMQGLS